MMSVIWTTPRTWVTGELVTAALLNTHLRDNMDYLKAEADRYWNQTALVAAASYSTTSTTFVDVDGVNLAGTIVTRGGPVLFAVSSAWKHSNLGMDCALDLWLNGARIGGGYGVSLMHAAGANLYQPLSWLTVQALPAGTHSFRLQWRTNSGTLTMGTLVPVTLLALELA